MLSITSAYPSSRPGKQCAISAASYRLLELSTASNSAMMEMLATNPRANGGANRVSVTDVIPASAD